VLENGVSVAQALRYPVEVQKIAILKNDHLICVGISSADGCNVERMIRVPAKSMHRIGRHPIVGTVRACERNLEDVIDVQVRLPHYKVSVTQINFEAIDGPGGFGRHGTLPELWNDVACVH
jgi:hypothetical protein